MEIFYGFAATYTRFIPYIKKNHDYGVVIFVLTFNLLTASSYGVGDVLKTACDRFYTIVIGCVVTLFMSLLVFPNWSGEDLHHSIISRLECLAKSIEVCVNEYFDGEIQVCDGDINKSSEDQIYKGYEAVLDSKSTDERLVSDTENSDYESVELTPRVRIPLVWVKDYTLNLKNREGGELHNLVVFNSYYDPNTYVEAAKDVVKESGSRD
ncbi:aluminum-activated malate transporter 12-like [Trifolium pratense]|uniref:aluminum-activated malate transporter 12-like n=1 Tax=Trifolium pratense TaxID=57577 RepID=UPI001E693292|nr:aluminum-activated malate transporter 12-like [Trifolium pratense]